MATSNILSDGGLVRGTQFSITVDGYTYLFKTGSYSQPVVSNFEKGATGLPAASSHVLDWKKISGEIMAYAGVPQPSQNYPFQIPALSATLYWSVGNLTLVQSTEGLRSYTCDLTQLAGTTASAFTTS